MLSNAYFLAKFRFDTAENEPAKNLQNLKNFKKLLLGQGLAPPTELEPVAVSPIDPVTKEEAGHPLLCFLRPLFP